MDPVRLFLEGYDQVVVGPEFEHADGSREARTLMLVHRVFEGTTYPQPTPRSPQVTVFELPPGLASTRPVRARVENEPRYEASDGVVRSRVARLPLDPAMVAAPGAAAGVADARGGDVTLTLELTPRLGRRSLAAWSCRLAVARSMCGPVTESTRDSIRRGACRGTAGDRITLG